ncbi:MAG: hypothetical protein AAF497_01540 [Planctomycetota bacterium]
MMSHGTNIVAIAAASLLLPLSAAAQFRDLPKPSRAPLIVRALDKDGDKKISQSESPDQLRKSFQLFDKNSDGGIDVGELKATLTMAAKQPESLRSNALNRDTINAPLPTRDPSFGTVNTKQVRRMHSPSPDQDRPFYMLNLVKFRERAVYRDGRQTKLTGRQANSLYLPMDFFAEIGAEIAYAGDVKAQKAGSRPAWDTVAIVKYPSRAKFVEMIARKDFQARSVHKDAGVELSQVVVTERVRNDASDAFRPAKVEPTIPATHKDSQFVLCQLLKYRDEAQYPKDRNEPRRSGREAMELYRDVANGVLRNVGARTILTLNVEGVYIGDGREWSECRLIRFPSQHAVQSVIENAQLKMVGHHRSAAIEDSYTLQLRTRLDRTAQTESVTNNQPRLAPIQIR